MPTTIQRTTPVETLLVAIPETAGSALYGMVDVLLAAGNVWQTLVRTEPLPPPFRVRIAHADAVVRSCEQLLQRRFREHGVLASVVAMAKIPERTLKRRFKQATGTTLIDYLQNLRIEEAKRLLEQGEMPVDEISFAVGYEDASFFRRIFKRRTSLTPREYRRMFAPMLAAGR